MLKWASFNSFRSAPSQVLLVANMHQRSSWRWLTCQQGPQCRPSRSQPTTIRITICAYMIYTAVPSLSPTPIQRLLFHTLQPPHLMLPAESRWRVPWDRPLTTLRQVSPSLAREMAHGVQIPLFLCRLVLVSHPSARQCNLEMPMKHAQHFLTFFSCGLHQSACAGCISWIAHCWSQP